MAISADDTGLAAVAARRRARGGAAAPALTRIDRPGRGAGWRPATVEAALPGLAADEWVAGHLALVRELLAESGAVRLRGMRLTAQTFGAMVSAVAGAPLAEYVNRSTPRSRVSGKVFTSTEYPRDQAIPMHSEQSYTRAWPLVLGFWCVHPAASGGETPLAPTDRVLRALPAELVERYEAHGVRYERWYQPHLDLPWQSVFQADSPAEVDRICAAAGIETQWHDGGVLHTRQVAQATTVCPASGRRAWFNQAHLFHVAALPAAARQALRATVGDRLPRHAQLGDGQPIPDRDIEMIQAAFASAAWHEPWCGGDVLLVDNIAVAHGRRPFTGDREVLVAMAGIAGDHAAGDHAAGDQAARSTP
jgi:alpha-ketoglutarate-dependent taurine dioxygenase